MMRMLTKTLGLRHRLPSLGSDRERFYFLAGVREVLLSCRNFHAPRMRWSNI